MAKSKSRSKRRAEARKGTKHENPKQNRRALSPGEALQGAHDARRQGAWGKLIEIAAAAGVRATSERTPHHNTRDEPPTHGASYAELRELTAEAHLRLGLKLRAEGRAQAAELELKRSTSMAPRDARGWYALGVLLHEINRLHDALDAYAQALTVRPGNPRVLYHRALALLDVAALGALDEDKRAATRALCDDAVQSLRAVGGAWRCGAERLATLASALGLSETPGALGRAPEDLLTHALIDLVSTHDADTASAETPLDPAVDGLLRATRKFVLVGMTGLVTASLEAWALAASGRHVEAGRLSLALAVGEDMERTERGYAAALKDGPLWTEVPAADADLRTVARIRGGARVKRRNAKKEAQKAMAQQATAQQASLFDPPELTASESMRPASLEVSASADAQDAPNRVDQAFRWSTVTADVVRSVLAAAFVRVGTSYALRHREDEAKDALACALACADASSLAHVVAALSDRVSGLEDIAVRAWLRVAESWEAQAKTGDGSEKKVLLHRAAIAYEQAIDCLYHETNAKMDDDAPAQTIARGREMSRLLKKAERLWPENVRFRAKQAIAAVISGEMRRAEQTARSAWAAKPKDEETIFMIVEVARMTGAAKLERECLEYLERKGVRDPRLDIELLQLDLEAVEAAVDDGRLDEALAACRQSAKKRPLMGPLRTWEAVLTHVVEGDRSRVDEVVHADGIDEPVDILAAVEMYVMLNRKSDALKLLRVAEGKSEFLDADDLARFGVTLLWAGGSKRRATRCIEDAIAIGGSEVLAGTVHAMMDYELFDDAFPYAERLAKYADETALYMIPLVVCHMLREDLSEAHRLSRLGAAQAARQGNKEAVESFKVLERQIRMFQSAPPSFGGLY